MLERKEMLKEKCPECGGDCAPECGRHPAGCTFGGTGDGYWLIMDGCDRPHEVKPDT